MDTRIADETTQLREMMDRALSRLNTCIPGEVDSFDADTQTATVLPAVQMKVVVEGKESYLDLPPVIQVPLVFPFASVAGFGLTLPVKKGDPCLLIFSQRAIDNWYQNGGVQPPEEGTGVRHHDLTDAFAILAAPPLPDVLGAWEAEGIELRNRDKSMRYTVKDTTVEAAAGTSTLVMNKDGDIVAKSDSLVKIDAPLSQFTGDVQIAGGITSTGAYGASGGKIQTPGDIESTEGDVKDNVRTMAGDRTIFNGHTHNGGSGPDQQQ